MTAGDTWSPLSLLPQGRAVRSLLRTPSGLLFAGLEMGEGQFTSYAYFLGPGDDVWQEAGYLYKADTIYDLLPTPGGVIYAATGDTYGIVLNTQLPVFKVYLPAIFRSIP